MTVYNECGKNLLMSYGGKYVGEKYRKIFGVH